MSDTISAKGKIHQVTSIDVASCVKAMYSKSESAYGMNDLLMRLGLLDMNN